MNRFSKEDKYNLIKCLNLRNENANLANDLYFELYPEKPQPDARIFKRLKFNLINYGSYTKPRSKNYNKANREGQENIVLELVRENPNTSCRQIEATGGVNRCKTHKILKKHKFRPYKTRLIHHLYPTDPDRRLQFCNWFVNKCNQEPDFTRRVIWTDESYISSDGIFNRYNDNHWCRDNPHSTITRQRQGRFGFSVWCGLIDNELIGPYFVNGNLTARSYIHILNNNLQPYLDNIGTPCYSSVNIFSTRWRSCTQRKRNYNLFE
ncbi:hypothetical protein NQ315_008892 [Exocentrus adspersus]|uniref:Transposase n=1 Tax=Exocentrus adspersus TaxID=1586481 RepID=A0AAV8V995_9CUCU|nr:hypothetical protein NQ315_008892 [Exocentrus adspersus]